MGGVEGGTRHRGLDGLRGVAIAAVVAFHGGVGLRGGALGVDLFLVLSGFLITSLLLRELDGSGRIDLGRFWGRRFRRLVPALLVVVTVVVVHGVLVGDVRPTVLRADALATLGYVANWRFVLVDGGYFAAFGAPSPLRHAWSLAVEEQWYLLWPPVLWALWRLVGRRPALLVAILLAGAGASAALMGRWAADVDRVHYGTDTRAQGLLVGAALAVVLHHRPLAGWSPPARRAAAAVAVPALALVGAGFVLGGGTERWLYRGGHLAFATVAAVALVGVLVPGPAGDALALRPLRWLGEISYGLYLWHWPVFVWLGPGRVGLERWPLFALRVAVSLALAVASARWVEQPFRRPGPSPTARPVLAAAGATAVAVLVIVAAVVAVPGDRARTALAAGPEVPPGFDVAAAGRTTAVAVVPAAPDGSLTVAVVGDSTGWRLAWQVEPPAGFVLAPGAVIGCGIDPAPIVLDGVPVPIEGDPVACDEAPALWEHVVTAQQPDVILLSLGAWEVFDRQLPDGSHLEVGTEAWSGWLRASLDAVAGRLATAAPGALVVVPEVPCFDEREDWLGGSGSARNDPARVAAVNQAVAAFAADNPARVALVPMGEWLCPGGAALGAIEDTTLRPDGVHLVPASAGLLWARRLGPALLDLVPVP